MRAVRTDRVAVAGEHDEDAVSAKGGETGRAVVGSAAASIAVEAKAEAEAEVSTVRFPRRWLCFSTKGWEGMESGGG